MPIFSGGSRVVKRYKGAAPIIRTYVGNNLVWQDKIDFRLERAATQPYRIMFLGSSTTQGYLINPNEGYVNNMLAAFMTAQPMVNSSSLVHQNTGSSVTPSQPGFHFLNAGLGGTTSANYYGTDRATLANGFKPTLVLHMIGSNDYHQQMPITTYKNNLNSVITDIDSKVGGSQNVQHVLIQSYRRTDRADTGITWAQYGQAQSEVAASRSNTTYIDTMPMFNAYGWSDKNLMADKIHTTVPGYELLARFVAQGMGLDDREGETIWAFDAGQFGIADNTPASSMPPTADSMQQANITSTGAARPLFRSNSSGKWLQFDGTDDYMDIASGFTGGHGMPITFYAVLESLGGTGGATDSQPFFSRSVGGDNGWWWVWREKGAHVMKSALNSAFGNANHMDTMSNTQRGIIAVTMFPNSRGRMYVNSKFSSPINAETVDTALGPWMKSLRLGSNSGLSNFSPVSIREVRFEHGGWDAEHVRSRIEQLATKHSVSLQGTDPKPNASIWMPYNTSMTQQAGSLSPSVEVTGAPQARDQYIYFPSTSRHRLAYAGSWSEGMTVAMWIQQTDSQSGWTTLFHRAPASGTITNEMYIVHNLVANNPRIHTGLKLGSNHKEVISTAPIPPGQWLHLAVTYQRQAVRSIFKARIYHNGIDVGNFEMTGYSTSGLFGSEPLHITGGRDAGSWGGNMDDFMVWNRALSHSEVNGLIYGKDDPALF